MSFSKRSIDGSGKCTVEPREGSTVLGVVFQVPKAEKPQLDEAEGLGHGYDESELVVISPDRNALRVLAYIANPRFIDHQLQPYTWYRDFFIAGAREHGFPADYIEALERTPATPDPDNGRDARNREIL